jgi:hypothetical protein
LDDLTANQFRISATSPTLIGDEWMHTSGAAYTDATSLAAIETELSSRFGWGEKSFSARWAIVITANTL